MFLKMIVANIVIFGIIVTYCKLSPTLTKPWIQVVSKSTIFVQEKAAPRYHNEL